MIRLFGHYVSKRYLLLGALEFSIFLISLLVGFEIGFPGADLQGPRGEALWIAVLYAVVMFSAMTAMGLYQRAASEGARAWCCALPSACCWRPWR